MSYQLKIDIQSYWHPGTGSGRGSDVDALTHRDANGLPVFPGKTLKGILRDAVARWEQFTQANDNPSLAEQLFGADAEADKKWLGAVRVSDAVLPDDIRYYLLQDKALATGLYRNIHATAIQHDTGTAVNKSLRGIEVIVPLTLYATLDAVPNAKYPVADWHKKIEAALGLIQAVGAHRTRGLGRAVVTLENKPWEGKK
jgi:CRISPR/Cas system CSM-associated protein Csm3 (group 7 of RAMP superfamily)